MRRVVLFGLVLVVVTVLSFLTVSPVDQRTLNSDKTTNLPASSGRAQVEAAELDDDPVPQEGRVDGRNAGHLTMVIHQVRFVGLTDTRMSPSSSPLEMSNRCATEISGTRMCFLDEVFHTIPPPADLPSSMWVFSSGTVIGYSCAGRVGGPIVCPGLPLPIACCGI